MRKIAGELQGKLAEATDAQAKAQCESDVIYTILTYMDTQSRARLQADDKQAQLMDSMKNSQLFQSHSEKANGIFQSLQSFIGLVTKLCQATEDKQQLLLKCKLGELAHEAEEIKKVEENRTVLERSFEVAQAEVKQLTQLLDSVRAEYKLREAEIVKRTAEKEQMLKETKEIDYLLQQTQITEIHHMLTDIHRHQPSHCPHGDDRSQHACDGGFEV